MPDRNPFLTDAANDDLMTDCDDITAHFEAEVRKHVHLAVIAEAVPVAEMHIDLAQFSEERARAFEELCEEE